ncbi:MAG: PorV/PorQ family protein, partial [Candidatus Saganbacteria bacterium]|nr:PorV/PorQ family protein [Candidatus Saganbacteria bacterium]
MSITVFAQTKTADDPTRVSVGARPLGMGNAYVGLADDINSIFINPAGLTRLTQWQATYLSGKLLSEVDYLNFGMAFPTTRGVFGIGYIGSNYGFSASATTIEAGRITTTTETTSYSDNDATWLFSYARPVVFQNLSFGATLKLFSKTLSGTGISNGGASGYEMDMGLLYNPNSVFSAGLTAKNILPASMGGKILWGTGLTESFPASLKAGISLKLLGYKAFRQWGEHRLLVNLDTDYPVGQSNLPMTWHLGLEWRPLRFLDIRAGVDQETVPNSSGLMGITSNLTGGIGLTYKKFRFDYAYHQFTDTPGLDNHFFSISFGLFKEEEIEIERERLEKERIERERLESERREKERIERERRERERKEKAKIERERRRKVRLEQLKKERARKELEKKQKELEENIRRERLERERRAREKLWKERREGFFSGVGGAINNIGNALGSAVSNTGKALGATGQGIGNVIGATGKALGTAGQNVGRAMGAAGQGIGRAIGGTGKAVGGTINNIGQVVRNFLFAAPPADEKIERELARARGEKVKEKAPTLVESFVEIRKVIRGEIPLSELGRIIP